MNKLIKLIEYWIALCAANIKVYKPEWKRLLTLSLAMMIQNTMFFVLWIILFRNVRSLDGWVLQDVARMYGLMATSCGFSLFFFSGARSIAYRLLDGTLDQFIAKPKSALPMVMTSASSPASAGDILYGPLIWALLGNMSGQEWALGLVLLIFSTILFTASMVMIFSLSFWLHGGTRFSEQLFMILIISSSIIQKGQPFVIQALLYTIIPSAFIVFLPVEVMRNFNWGQMAMIAGATVGYATLAAWMFNRGLRRYTMAN